MINIQIQKKDLWLLAAIMIFLVGVGYVIAYNSGSSPSVMGHSAEELEGVQRRITGTCGAGSSIRVINTNGTVTCETDDGAGTDTRCDTSGTCAQVCIGTNCRSSWPVDTDTRCDVSGRCSQICIGTTCKSSWAAAICTWGSKTYTTGAECWSTCDYSTGRQTWKCGIDGSWSTSDRNCQTVSCCGC